MCESFDERYTVYINSDGRTRMYDKITHKVTSYPRYLMEIELGRPLETDEDVHHIDGNPLNNDISNLEVIKHGEHQRMHSTKYYDKMAICSYCGKEFMWSSLSQRNHNSNKKRYGSMMGPFCCRRCAALGSFNEHHSGNTMSECE